jgi:hypothetical protein
MRVVGALPVTACAAVLIATGPDALSSQDVQGYLLTGATERCCVDSRSEARKGLGLVLKAGNAV